MRSAKRPRGTVEEWRAARPPPVFHPFEETAPATRFKPT
jgi:hypothetical protein